MIPRRVPRWGLMAALSLVACGSRSSLELAIDGAASDGGVDGNGGSGANQSTGGSGGQNSGGQGAGGQGSGGRNTGGVGTGGQGAGGTDSGGQGAGGQNTGGQGAGGQSTGGQGSGGANTGGSSGGQGTGGVGNCPFGFVDEGDGCQPILTALISNFATVIPTVTPFEREYDIMIPLWTEGLTLTPFAANGVTIEISNQAVASGEPWRPHGLTPGTASKRWTILTAAGHPETSYQFAFRRQGRLDYLKAPNTSSEDGLGLRVALSADGRTLAVGAVSEDSGSSGIDGDQNDDSAPAAGAVYVFVREGDVWKHEAYIKASNPDTGDCFGVSLDLSADGNVLVVGAHGEDSAATGIQGDSSDDSASYAGAAYVFSRAGTTWQEEAYVKASNTEWADLFGWSVAVSDDGTTFAVGAYGEDSSAMGVGGDQELNDASMTGAAYVFSRSAGGIVQEAYVKASNPDPNDAFGTQLVLSGDGSTLIVSAPDEDSAAVGVGGDQSNDGATSAGAVYAFSRVSSTWAQSAYIKASNSDPFDVFGSAMALSSDGSTLAVGAFAEQSLSGGINGDQGDDSGNAVGAVYVLALSGPVWVQEAYIKASNPHSALFGRSLALSESGDVLFVGASGEDSGETGIDAAQNGYLGALDSGAAYRFVRGSIWTQSAYIKASNTDSDDDFGRSVATSSDGNVLAVGAPGEASASTYINSDPANGDAPQSGAAYVFSEE